MKFLTLIILLWFYETTFLVLVLKKMHTTVNRGKRHDVSSVLQLKIHFHACVHLFVIILWESSEFPELYSNNL